MVSKSLGKVAAKIEENLDLTRLRVQAGTTFITSPEKISIDHFLRDPRFVGVSEETLRRWKREDKWTSRRKEMFESIAAKAREALASDLVQTQIDERRRMLQIRDVIDVHLLDDELRPKPKTLEGLARARASIGQRIEELAANIIQEVVPKEDEAKAANDALLGVELDSEEQQILVQALMAHRRGKKQIAATTDGHDDGQERGEASPEVPGEREAPRREDSAGGYGLDGWDDPDS